MCDDLNDARMDCDDRKSFRRHVLYIPGFDARRPAIYLDLFSSQLREWSVRFGVPVEAKFPGELTNWSTIQWEIARVGAGPTVNTQVEVCVWNDIIKDFFALPFPTKMLRAFRSLLDALISQRLFRWMRWSWRTTMVVHVFPWLALAFYVAVALAWLLFCIGIERFLWPQWFAAPVAMATGLAGLMFWRSNINRWERTLYVFYLINVLSFCVRQRNGLEIAADRRFDLFAERLAAIAEEGSADEILVFGHSLGAAVAAIIVARAMQLSPRLASGAAHAKLVTAGAYTVAMCDGPGPNAGASAMGHVLANANVPWIDFYAPGDVLSYARFDYKSAYNLQTPEWTRADLRSTRFAEIMDVKVWRALQWRFFDKHFTYLLANNHCGEYDFYKLLLDSAQDSQPLQSAA